ncbi:hypothetical protein PT974_10881 [Cladobotryum mycophilum]|uniref:Uncharacterized protein n=1 Tax=Cladobotryum mycophilum TaxID=491253 RepID=A0ABR0SB19_9HYPO
MKSLSVTFMAYLAGLALAVPTANGLTARDGVFPPQCYDICLAGPPPCPSNRVGTKIVSIPLQPHTFFLFLVLLFFFFFSDASMGWSY